MVHSFAKLYLSYVPIPLWSSVLAVNYLTWTAVDIGSNKTHRKM